jgi:aminoglycoside/choline kinase family phosphotransferase
MSPSDAPGPAPRDTPITHPVLWHDEQRRLAFEAWLAECAPRHGLDASSLSPASSDASFRRYLRLQGRGGSFIVMDAPPAHEDVRPFVAVAGLLQQAGLHVPQVLEQHTGLGLLLLTDLGDSLYLDALQAAVAAGNVARREQLMREAIAALIVWQSRGDASDLPPYDEALLRRELALFPEWCVAREFGQAWSAAQQAQWQAACDLLVVSALAQPVVAVHRDYMPRNLMVAQPNPGILDFQDAVRGPITYDLASLLRDAFISWDEELELDWAVRHWEAARAAGLPVDPDFGEFWRQLEWMGLQRHLKVLGIFCRLKHRDGKPRYSADLPRFFGYAHRVALRYRPLGPLCKLIEPLMGMERVEAFH